MLLVRDFSDGQTLHNLVFDIVLVFFFFLYLKRQRSCFTNNLFYPNIHIRDNDLRAIYRKWRECGTF